MEKCWTFSTNKGITVFVIRAFLPVVLEKKNNLSKIFKEKGEQQKVATQYITEKLLFFADLHYYRFL